MGNQEFFYIGIVVGTLAALGAIFFLGLKFFGFGARRAAPYSVSLVCLCILGFAVIVYFKMLGK